MLFRLTFAIGFDCDLATRVVDGLRGVTPCGVTTTVRGTQAYVYAEDGAALIAQLRSDADVAAHGDVFATDPESAAIVATPFRCATVASIFIEAERRNAAVREAIQVDGRAMTAARADASLDADAVCEAGRCAGIDWLAAQGFQPLNAAGWSPAGVVGEEADANLLVAQQVERWRRADADFARNQRAIA